MRDQVVTQLGLAGPEVLLVGLRKAIKFDQREEGTLDDRPVDIIRGTWLRPEGLAGPNLTPQQQMAPLPSFVPSLVRSTSATRTAGPTRSCSSAASPRS